MVGNKHQRYDLTYFLLSITNACNKACGYCVVKPWLNNPLYPDKCTAQDFIGFLQKEMKPGDVVEITGGEPTMFTGLISLLEWLKENGARAILRTNGILLDEWRGSYPNMAVVLARHNSSKGYMRERKRCLLPQDLVLEGIPEHIKQKAPCKPVFANDETSPLSSHPFKRAFFLTNDGKIRFMPCIKADMGNITAGWKAEKWDCMAMDKCPYMLGAWNIISRRGAGGK
jgi:hypothetical protein